MKNSIYNKRLFITDLILVSVWALFLSPYCSNALLPIIAVRIAMSFAMYRKSPWSLVSAVGFLLAFFCYDKVSTCYNFAVIPFRNMLYYLLCVFGKSEQAVSIFSRSLSREVETLIHIVSLLGFIWLAIFPVIVGIRFRNIKEINWRDRWIWIYLLPWTALGVWVMFTEGSVGCVLLGYAIVALPVVHWCIHDCKGRSPIQLIIEDKTVLWYFAYAGLMAAALTIGLKDIASLRLIGLLTLPALFYIMLTVSMRLGTVLTRCCLALSLSGLLCWLTLDHGEPATTMLLATAIVLIIVAGTTMIVRTRTWTAPLLLMATVPTIIIPGTMGLNPYVVRDAEYTWRYITNPTIKNGVYVITKYAELAEMGTPYYWRYKYGLRDRYGIILPMEYNELKVIDGYGRYITTNYHLRYGSPKSDQRYGVFDLQKRKFVIHPDSMEVTALKEIDKQSFKLINPNGKHFATLYLPGDFHGVYYRDLHIEFLPDNGGTSIVKTADSCRHQETFCIHRR